MLSRDRLMSVRRTSDGFCLCVLVCLLTSHVIDEKNADFTIYKNDILISIVCCFKMTDVSIALSKHTPTVRAVENVDRVRDGFFLIHFSLIAPHVAICSSLFGPACTTDEIFCFEENGCCCGNGGIRFIVQFL